MFIIVTHGTITSKESACRIICMLCKQTALKCWFAKVNMTSYNAVTNSAYPVTLCTIRDWSILEFGRGHTTKQSPRASSDLCRPLVRPHQVNHYVRTFDLCQDLMSAK